MKFEIKNRLCKEIVIDTMHMIGLTIPRLILICAVAFWIGYFGGGK